MPAKKDVGVFIRNTRAMPVHVRFTSVQSEKPYRVQLNRRGLQGDCVQIPSALKESPEFNRSLQAGIFEIIPSSEANSIEYPPVGYQGMASDIDAEWAKPISVVRDADRTVATLDESGKQVRIDRVANPQPADTKQAREVVRPDAAPQVFQDSGMSPINRNAPGVTQQTPTRKPVNRNPVAQKPNTSGQ